MGLSALSLGLLDISNVVQIWHVYLVAFIVGLITVVDNPTRQAFVSRWSAARMLRTRSV